MFSFSGMDKDSLFSCMVDIFDSSFLLFLFVWKKGYVEEFVLRELQNITPYTTLMSVLCSSFPKLKLFGDALYLVTELLPIKCFGLMSYMPQYCFLILLVWVLEVFFLGQFSFFNHFISSIFFYSEFFLLFFMSNDSFLHAFQKVPKRGKKNWRKMLECQWMHNSVQFNPVLPFFPS